MPVKIIDNRVALRERSRDVNVAAEGAAGTAGDSVPSRARCTVQALSYLCQPIFFLYRVAAAEILALCPTSAFISGQAVALDGSFLIFRALTRRPAALLVFLPAAAGAGAVTLGGHA